jgi:undecaprenyl pyrophosphate phosphatase UppP
MPPLIHDTLLKIADFIQPYHDDIALAIVATLLVIYGDDINKFVKKNIGKKPLMVRMLAFIALCTFGYGYLTVQLTNIVQRFLTQFNPVYLPLLVLGALFFFAFLAERKNQV